ncbi:helix-turn-helix domain-containing protein [Sphaerisporangium aureirubrum]|uniref:Helix-turn-helix domain-containing protein n=1 Tax=Sphaerisporangium aureirubrum TaxID=1544736 RepID=A0ABW1NCE9_9ACTN
MGSTSTFGQTLRRKREEAGFSLRRLARLVCYSPGWMSRIENGLASPTLQMAQICDRQLAANGELIALAQDVLINRQRLVLPAQVPRGTDRLIGRDQELRFLDNRLERSRTTATGMVVSIEGDAGVGKTELAKCWAHRVAESFEDGVLFADLQGYSVEVEPVASEQVLEGFLTALGTEPASVPEGLDQRAALLRTLTARRQILMVLDNAVNSRQVQPLLPNGPGCTVLVTSRRRLKALTVRDMAASLQLDPLAAKDAVDVLQSMAAGACEDEAATTRLLARQCGRVPLALRIAGFLLSTSRRARDLARDMSDPSTRLDLLSDTDDTTLSVRAALERSYQDLDGDAARMFRLLGLVPLGVGAAAASEMSGWPGRRTRRALESLVDVHLAHCDDTGRYVLGELDAAFAAEKAAEEETDAERGAALDRLTAWSRGHSPVNGEGITPINMVYIRPE